MTATEPEIALQAAPIVAASEPSHWLRVGRGLRGFVRRAPFSSFWGCLAAVILLMAVAAPLIAPYEPLKSDFRAMTKPADQRHVLRTAKTGRDTLSRVIYGSRSSLTVAIVAVLFGTPLCCLWALASGYFARRFD